jgi:enhancer of yellow 2 transcription factor
VQDESRRIVQEKGVDTVSLQQLVQDVTPFARKQVPVEVKHEILQLMKKFIEDKSGVEL